jgi:ankyrin repeat protein
MTLFTYRTNDPFQLSIGNGPVPLIVAVEQNRIEIAKILIRHGVYIDQVSTEDGHTAFGDCGSNPKGQKNRYPLTVGISRF